MKKGNCYGQEVGVNDLVVAEDSEFDVSRNRVYLVRDSGFGLITIKNDLGKIDSYAAEYFRFYQGEKIDSL